MAVKVYSKRLIKMDCAAKYDQMAKRDRSGHLKSKAWQHFYHIPYQDDFGEEIRRRCQLDLSDGSYASAR